MTEDSRVTRDPELARAGARYRRAWRAYPESFRRRFEQPAVEVFEARYREERNRRGRIGMMAFWVRSIATVVAHGLAERVSGLGSSRGRGAWGADLQLALRGAWRGVRQQGPSILCIALGVAATGAVITLLNATLLRPLPFPEPDRLIRVWSVEEGVELAGRGQLSYPDLADLREALTSLDAFVVTGRARRMFLGDDGARRVEGEAVGPGYLELLGVEPFLGRPFAREDHEAGSPPTMILSYGTWVRDFGGDADILGRVIRTAGGAFTVVGVMPQDFVGTIEADIPDLEFWVPLEHHVNERFRTSRQAEFIWTIGRLAPGANLDRARQELDALGQRLRDQGVLQTTDGYWAEPFGENWRADLRWRNLLLLGASLLLLMVAATSVAGLQLTRALGRRREVAVRAALGASPSRIFRLSAMEILIITAVGGGLGVIASPFVLRAFMSLAPETLPSYLSLDPDWRSLGIAVGVIAVAAFMSAVGPALWSARVAPGAALVAGGRSSTQTRGARATSRWLVAGEVALSMVLISTAALLVQSYRAMGTADVGFRTTGILKLAVFVDSQDVPDQAALLDFYGRLKEAVTSVPGVEAVGYASPTVPPGFSGEARVRFDGMPEGLREAGILTYVHLADPELLPVLEVPILAGRGIENDDDGSGSRVAVVSASLAETMGGVDRAVGRSVEMDGATVEVVGVAGDVMYMGTATPRPRDIDIYIPITQDPSRIVSMAVRTATDPAGFIAPIRAEIARLSPRSPLDWIDTMPNDLRRGFEGPRFYTVLLLAFAGSALVLTAAGLFAVLARAVAAQRVEMGVRRAFGARRRDLLTSVVRSGLSVCGAGVAVGAAVALVVAVFLGRTLYGIGAFDPRAVLVASVVILATGMSASLLPAYRATSADPTEAIRDS